MGETKLHCVVCGAEISYRFGRPRKVCDNDQCQKALQRIRIRRFKLKKKRIRREAIQATLKVVTFDSYEPTIYNTDLGNLLNVGEGGSLKVIPDYSDVVFRGYREPNELTIEFVKNSIEFYHKHPDLVRYPDMLKPSPKAHRIGIGIPNVMCGVCGASSLLWRSEGGWFCQECGNDTDFSLPIY